MKFVKGTSGNPSGARKGRAHRITGKVRELVNDASVEVIKKVIENAKTGDVEATRLFLRFLMPKHRFVAQPVDLPEARNAGEIQLQIAKLASMAAAGEMDLGGMTEIARTLALSLGARLSELEELLEEREADDGQG